MFCELLPHNFLKLRDNGLIRYSKFSSGKKKPQGTLLVVPGAREFIEKKYFEIGRDFIEKGFDVIIYEPRGQGMSSRFLSGDMRQRNHITDFNIHIEDLQEVYSKVVKPHVKTRESSVVLCHGHSLGGHILLRWLAENEPNVSGAFLTAPMISILGMAVHMMSYGVSWASVCMLANDTEYFTMNHDWGGDDLIFENNPLTGDESRFRVMENFFKAHPKLVTGGVTWGWMLCALRSLNIMQTWSYLNKVKTPVLSLSGEFDTVTPHAEILPFLNMMPDVQIEIIPDASHDILSETDSVRREALKHLDTFVNRVLQPKKCFNENVLEKNAITAYR